jgi:hypothetical protein
MSHWLDNARICYRICITTRERRKRRGTAGYEQVIISEMQARMQRLAVYLPANMPACHYLLE